MRYWDKEDGNAKVIPYLWDDRKLLWAARLQTETVCEEVLPVLSEWLNTVHGESHDVSYWRIIVGPFLIWYVESLLDRYETLKNAKRRCDGIYTIGMLEGCYKTPVDIAEFMALTGSSDAWNVQLYTQLCSFLNITVDNRLPYEWNKQDITSVSELAVIKRCIRIFLEKIAFNFQRWLLMPKAEIMLTAYWMPIRKRIKMLLFSRLRVAALPYYRNRDVAKKVERDCSLREELKSMKMDNTFAEIVMQTLTYNFPMQYLEAYKPYREEALKVFGRKIVKMAVTDLGHFNSNLLPIWLAYNKENGAKVAILQHGGGYGDRAWNLIGKHELKISDYFFTWGWSESAQTVPIGLFKSENTQCSNWRTNKSIFLVCTGVTKFPFGLPSAPLSTQYLDYIDWQCQFLGLLDEKKFDNTIYRKYRGSMGWREEEIILDRYPNISFDQNLGPHGFNKSMRECRLFIGDNMNTTFLEALALNIPTILFWNTSSYESRESVKEYYDRLRDVGIFHDSPEAAAEKVNEVYDDVGAWWLSEDVQATRQEFCHQFAREIKNKESTLTKIIMKLS